MGGATFSRALVAAGAAAALALGAPAASHADDTVVVRGTAFPDANAQLAYVGCTDLLAPDASQPLQPYIGRGPGQAPAGARSLGYDLAGGTAIGSQHVVSSVIGNNIATLSVFAPRGGHRAGRRRLPVPARPGDDGHVAGRRAGLGPRRTVDDRRRDAARLHVDQVRHVDAHGAARPRWARRRRSASSSAPTAATARASTPSRSAATVRRSRWTRCASGRRAT